MNLPLALDSVPSDGTGYVFAAYLFFLLVVVVYIGILGVKFQRINKELGQLNEELEAKAEPATAPVAETAQPAEAGNG